MKFNTISYRPGVATVLDQTKLPTDEIYSDCKTVEEMWDAIKRLVVRGAPLIGVSAAYGMCLAARQYQGNDLAEMKKYLIEKADYLATSRPTAVNLFWALDRMNTVINDFASGSLEDLTVMIEKEAESIYQEDLSLSRAIGENGASLIEEGDVLLTHCNAGGLATSGMGTALSPVFQAHVAGKKLEVYADETRPLLQGSRLTTWELKKAGIPVTLICDSMAASLMKKGKITKVIVGADRITANGDVANKIGTYSLAVLASYHHIPFYVAAPYSTIDLELSGGSLIEIEERKKEEITHSFGRQTAPDGIGVFNPAFDVTPAELITGIITEKGVLAPPFSEALTALKS